MSHKEKYFDSGQSIIESLGIPPAHSTVQQDWAGVQMFGWLGDIDHCRFESCDEILIIYHRAGAPRVPVEVIANGITSVSRPSLISILPKSCKVGWDVEGGVRSFTLHIADSYFPSLLAAKNVSDHLVRYPKLTLADPYICATLDMLSLEMISPKEDSDQYSESIVTALASYVSRFIYKDGPQSTDKLNGEVLTRILDYIDRQIESEISIDFLAKLSGKKRGDFYREFYNTLGKTPYQYVIGRRLALAKNILLDQKMGLSEVALRCGFSSQSHFSAVFKRSVGMTPNVYRNFHSNKIT